MASVQRSKLVVNGIMNSMAEVATSALGQYLAKPVEVVSRDMRVFLLKTGDRASRPLQLHAHFSCDDRALRFAGGGIKVLNPTVALPHIVGLFSAPTGFAGVAVRLNRSGDLIACQSHDLPHDRSHILSTEVLERLLERGIASTAFLEAAGLFANLCDSGLEQEFARSIARDPFEQYMSLFDMYGVACYFDPNTDEVGCE